MAPTHRSLSIATEATFASIDATTGLPSSAGLSFISALVDRDPIVVPGDAAVNERMDARDGPFGLAAEPDTTWSAGARVRRRVGTISVRCDLTTLGTGANYAATGLGRLLSSALKYAAAPASSDTVTGTSPSTFTPTLGSASYYMGNIIGALIAGRSEYGAITSNDQGGGGDIAISPALSASVAAASTAYQLDTWYLPTSTQSGGLESTLALRIDAVGVRTYCYGCVVETLALSHEGGRIMADFTLVAAHITDDHASATGPIEPIYPDGAAPHFRGTYVTLGATASTSLSDIAGTTGDTYARLALDCESFTVSLTNTVSPKAYSNDITGISGWEISDATVEATLTLSTALTTVDDDLYNMTPRCLMIGSGPIGAGQGMAVNIPAAVLTSDASKRDISGEIITQILNYRASRFGGDIPNAQNRGSNTPFRLGLGG